MVSKCWQILEGLEQLRANSKAVFAGVTVGVPGTGGDRVVAFEVSDEGVSVFEGGRHICNCLFETAAEIMGELLDR